MNLAPPRRFYLVAAGAGFAFANMAIAVPLHVVAAHEKASVAGDVLALATIAVAVGALAAGRTRAGALALAIAVTGCGSLTLAAASSIVLLAAGGTILGAGIGMFWVASHQILARRAGEPDGARAFLSHYAAYTFGAVAGSTVTGGLASGAKALGLGPVAGIRAASGLALAGAMLAAIAWRGCAHSIVTTLPRRGAPPTSRQLAVQVPDLLLVSALALLLPLAPVVLAREFGLAPFSIGIVMGSVALAKIVGTFVARAITRSRGSRRTILILLAGSAAFCVLLCSALTLSLFVSALLATALAGTGAWPLVVDAAQARVEPAERRTLSVRWNAREYVLIAAMTAAAGWMLTAVGSAIPVFAIAALLFVGAAASASFQLGRAA
jgi:hypothetical protein